MAYVYLIVDSVGAHEPDPVFSVWDSRSGAEAEIVRFRSAYAALINLPADARHYPCLTVIEVPVNTPSETWVNG